MGKSLNALILILCIILISACSEKQEPVRPETSDIQEELNPAESSERGDIIEEEYVEVRELEENETLYKDPSDVLAQAQAAQESGENVKIHFG